MIAFLDSSVVLRRLFGEPDSLPEWPNIREAWASRLLSVELGRVIDRARLAGEIDDDQVVELQHESRRALRSVQVVGLSDRILDRAAGPMPTTLGSLDAIHLSTALEIAATRAPRLVVATHDRQLAKAAKASGLEVVGV